MNRSSWLRAPSPPRLDGTVIGAYSYDRSSNRLTKTRTPTATGPSNRYDRSSNRLTKTEDTDDDDILESFASAYDRTDALVSQTIDNDSPQPFTYDPAGNVTTERTRTGSSRTLTWDAANRLTAITPASGNAATLTYDPLDRVATRTVTGSSARTFAYIGASDLAWQVPSGSADARLLTGSDGSQPGVSRSGTAKWLLPDLLGSVALAQPATGSITTSDALRTDAWGTAIGTYPSTGSDLAVRFRGLVDLSPTADPDTSGTGSDPLYEMGARTYSPHTGSFSSLDTYPGSATNPISMSRYLYAHADPATLIDPTGHKVTEQDSAGTPTEESIAEVEQLAQQHNDSVANSSKPGTTTTSGGTSSTGGQQAGGAVDPFDGPQEAWRPPSIDAWMRAGDRWRDWYIANFWDDAATWTAWGDNDETLVAYWILASATAGDVELDSVEMLVSHERFIGFRDTIANGPYATDDTWGTSLALAGLTGYRRPLVPHGTLPDIIYRSGGANPGNLKIRPGHSALSFRDSLSNPIDRTLAVFQLGDEYIGIDTTKLRRGAAVVDGIEGSRTTPPGHVSVSGTDWETLKRAIIERGKFR